MSDNCGCEKYGCTCVEYSIDEVISSNDNFIVKMKHMKCRVTHLVRNQMRKSVSELRERNYSSYSGSSKSSGKSVNNKATQLSSLSSINPHESKLIDHTTSRQLTASSQEYTTESSRPNYSNSTLERSKAAGGYQQPTARMHPVANSTLIDTLNSSKVPAKMSHGSNAQKSYAPYNVVTIHPPPLSQSSSTLPQVSASDFKAPATKSVAVETLPNMFEYTEFTPSNFNQTEGTTMDSSTQATSQVTTSTQATDLTDKGTSTAKIQTDVITLTTDTSVSTTTTTTTTTSFILKFIRIIFNGVMCILSFLYRIKKIILMILMIGLLLWAAVIYGAILGAAICTSAGGYPLFQITLPPARPVYF
ncbi:uncharacterized protein LOC141531050 [Cotesia typhae]|uniref:uncharacterized protein LOC141531050 n=1 Tax=Cotesia typhae TaxID=2053667 RepID=UPI003D69FC25